MLIKNMATKFKNFIASNAEKDQGVQDMNKQEIIDSLIVYKRQNPKKFEEKKASLLAKYNLKESDLKVTE